MREQLRRLLQDWGREGHHLMVKLRVCAEEILLSCAVGLLAGAFSTAFAWALKEVTGLRQTHGQLLLLLPFAGLVIVFLYRRCGVPEDKGTNLVLSSVNADSHVPGRMSVLIFLSTLLTHLCGGSAGREGAALQIGGSLGNTIARVLKRGERTTRVLIMAGMSAAFAAVFGTPMAAALFSMEVVSVGVMQYSALVPCVFAAIVASSFSATMGINPEAFAISSVPALSLSGGVKICILALLCAALSALFIIVLHGTGHLLRQWFSNPYVRIAAGGCVIVALTLLSGTGDYNGAGIEIIERAVAGEEIAWWTFAVKLLFTAITLQSGFKGGEIVPSFCVGAAFGSCYGVLAGMSPGFCAAIGMVSVFCGVTNCPLTTLLISFELFGFEGVPYFMMAIAVSYLLSGYRSLYSAQIIATSKYRPGFINRSAGDESEDDLEE